MQGLILTPLHYAFMGLVGLLSAGSLASLGLPKLQQNKWDDLVPRMRSWWVMCLIVCGSLLAGWQAFTLTFAFISFVALREFMSLAPLRRDDRYVAMFAYIALALSYAAIWANNYQFFLVTIPVYVFLGSAVLFALTGRTEGLLTSMGVTQWGVMLCGFALAHVAFLMRVPAAELPAAGAAGLVFLLIFTTQFNDVAQYMWGKTLGRTQITPNISPNKTWEGAIGGFLTTAAVFVVLAPYFTPLSVWQSVGLGLLLPIAGFFGDITMSAIKRDLGVKDTSQLLPGHGGALDRLDSLMFTAPIYFHFLAYFALERF